MPAEQAAEGAEKGWLAQTRENYRALRKNKLGPAKSILLATKPGFHPGLLKEIDPDKLADAFAEKSEAAMTKFAGMPKEFFQPFTRDEFAHYLMVSKRMSPVKAHYEAWVHGKSSPYYRSNKASAHGFALENWANWKANQVTQILFNRDYNRERNDPEAWTDTKEEIAKAIVHGVNSSGTPRLDLKVFWGGHKEGASGEADADDAKVLSRLKILAEQIRAKGVDANVHVLFSDVHSAKVNKVDDARIEKYHEGIAKLAEKYGFPVSKMSDVWKAANPFNVPGWEKSAIAAAETVAIAERLGLVSMGVKSAERHAQQVISGEETPEDASKNYSTVVALEKQMLDKLRGPEALYVTFEDPKVTTQKPAHTLHMWAFQRGRSDRPWFKKKAE